MSNKVILKLRFKSDFEAISYISDMSIHSAVVVQHLLKDESEAETIESISLAFMWFPKKDTGEAYFIHCN